MFDFVLLAVVAVVSSSAAYAWYRSDAKAVRRTADREAAFSALCAHFLSLGYDVFQDHDTFVVYKPGPIAAQQKAVLKLRSNGFDPAALRNELVDFPKAGA